MQDEMPKLKPKKPNEARKRLKEVKRPVPNPLNPEETILKSFYGRSHQEAERKWQECINPALKLDIPEGTLAWYVLHRYSPLKSHLGDKTIRKIRVASGHLLSEIGHLQVSAIGAPELCRALEAIAAKETCRNPNIKDPKNRVYRRLGASTVNQCRQLALECNELASEEDMKVRRINRRRVPVRDEQPLDVDVYAPAEMRMIIEATKGTSWYLPTLIYCTLGLRLSEALGTLKEDITPQGVYRVLRQDDGQGGTTTKLKTKYSRRDIPLPADLLEELRPHTFGDGRLCTNSARDPKTGKLLQHPIGTSNYRRGMATICRRIGIRWLGPHKFRHSFSSWLDNNGCPRAVRLEIMGQSRKAVMDRYNHASTEKMRSEIQRLYEAIQTDPLERELAPAAKITPENRNPAAGTKNGRSVLSEQDVLAIRASPQTPTELGKAYNVDRTTIKAIKERRTWKHVA
jgi:integrase